MTNPTRVLTGFTLLCGMMLSSVASADPSVQGPSPAPQQVDKPPSPSLYRKNGLLGPVRLGPTIGFGAPDGLRFGAFAKWRGLLAVGGAFSYLPDMAIPGVDANVVRVSGEVFARVHPFRGAFFAGIAGGYAQTKGTMVETQVAFHKPQRVEAHAYGRTAYIAPHVGYQWMLPMRLTVGFDVGVEIPIASDGPDFDAKKYGLVVPVEGKGNVADATRYVTSMPIPVVHLLEIGYAL